MSGRRRVRAESLGERIVGLEQVQDSQLASFLRRLSLDVDFDRILDAQPSDVLQSAGYVADTSGWKISGDTVEFNEAVIRTADSGQRITIGEGGNPDLMVWRDNSDVQTLRIYNSAPTFGIIESLGNMIIEVNAATTDTLDIISSGDLVLTGGATASIAFRFSPDEIETFGPIQLRGSFGTQASGSANLIRTVGEDFKEITSMRAGKTNIRSLSKSRAEAAIRALTPVQYEDALLGTANEQHGLIAEDVAATEPVYAQYGEDGKPRSINWWPLTAGLVRVVQDLIERVETLET